METYMRSKGLNIFVCLMFFVLILILNSVYAQIPEGTQCNECGMKVDPSSRFASYIVTTDGKRLFFCDIGDMLGHLRKKKYEAKEIFVKDYQGGDWIDGQNAYYVYHKKFSTPMGWGIAAFKNLSETESWGKAVDFNHAFKLLK